MLTQEEDVEVHALRKQGWTISEIARHTGRDRKTIRAYLAGERQPGVRAVVEEDPFDRIEAYVAQRLADDTACGERPCSMRSKAWGMTVRIRRSPANSVNESCVRIAKPAAG